MSNAQMLRQKRLHAIPNPHFPAMLDGKVQNIFKESRDRIVE